MITKIIIRVDNSPFKEIYINTEKQGRALILAIENQVVPDSFDFCKPLIITKCGGVRGHIQYIIDRRDQFIHVI